MTEIEVAQQDSLISLHSLRRLARPEKVANVAIVFISGDVNFVTGAYWLVAGIFSSEN